MNNAPALGTAILTPTALTPLPLYLSPTCRYVSADLHVDICVIIRIPYISLVRDITITTDGVVRCLTTPVCRYP